MQNILITGGAGYIGSHTAKAIMKAGFQPVVYDNLSRGFRELVKFGPLVVGNLHDSEKLAATLHEFKPIGCIHFAAFAYVGESVSHPGLYYRNNVLGSLNLIECLLKGGVNKIVFSSTCATYGQPEVDLISETTPQKPINPYGHSKLMVEQLLKDFDVAHGLKSVALRYFNACGADADGEIGEMHDPEPAVEFGPNEWSGRGRGRCFQLSGALTFIFNCEHFGTVAIPLPWDRRAA